MLITNKAIDSMLKSLNSILIYKLDIEKVYNHVN